MTRALRDGLVPRASEDRTAPVERPDIRDRMGRSEQSVILDGLEHPDRWVSPVLVVRRERLEWLEARVTLATQEPVDLAEVPGSRDEGAPLA